MENTISKSTKWASALLLFAEAVTVIVPVIILGKYFNFPDILRQPASNSL